MRMRELTLTQLSSVPCPSCGVAAGQHCLLRSGARALNHTLTGSSPRLSPLKRRDTGAHYPAKQNTAALNPLVSGERVGSPPHKVFAEASQADSPARESLISPGKTPWPSKRPHC